MDRPGTLCTVGLSLACVARTVAPTAGGTSTADASSTEAPPVIDGAAEAEVEAEADAASGVDAEATTLPPATGSSNGTSTGGPVWPCELPSELPEICWDSVCDYFFVCGDANSYFDSQGCPRTICESDADCDAAQYCSANFLVSAETNANHAGNGSNCDDFMGECVCGSNTSGGVDSRGFCLDPVEFPPADTCLAADVICDHLPNMVATTYEILLFDKYEIAEDLFAQAVACQVLRLPRLVDDCGWTACELLGEIGLHSACGAMVAPDCSATDPGEALALMEAIFEHVPGCPTCEICDELDGDLCATLLDC